MADYPVTSGNPAVYSAFLAALGGLQAPPIYNPSGLRRWKVKYASSAYLVARINVEGDSRPAGVGVDNVNAITNNVNSDKLSFAGVLRSRFARALGVNEAGFISARAEGTDTRIAASGATDDSTTDPYQLTKRINSTGPQTVTIANDTPATNLELLTYNDANIAGSITYAVDGGAGVVLANNTADVNGATTGVKRFNMTPTPLTAAPHSVVFTGNAAGNALLFGMDYHSGSGVLVRRRARAGYTTLDMAGLGAAFPGNNLAVGNSAAATRMLATAGLGNADLTIIQLDYNDWQAQISANYTSGLKPTPDVYATYLKQRVDACIAAGGCVLLLGGANSPGAGTPAGGQDLSAYWNVAKNIANTTDHCSCIILSEIWKSAADGVALGLNASATSIHYSRLGGADIANMLFFILSSPGFFGV